MPAPFCAAVLPRPGKPSAGFTLIELMVTMAIVAILTAIALPLYQNYIIRSNVKAAGADLVALALVVENSHQLTFSYPADNSSVTSSATGFSGFGPTEGNLFTYSLTNSATAPFYTLTARGISGTMVAGCTLQLDAASQRSLSAGSSTPRACGYLASW
ncbi:prepilin-type N-terminal cleavage/methylation domain-containing protein [Silvimonas terrae]|uniref:Prepilin-type N-terminal cleavage/methylation domain-containing protein n=1 Tax=Silvimonas terrae TaxID=300266 RepID=A0A840RD40_9NEIS|nr:prepilin-type N-terminal cleavage/methylation domain-containing protein [Silvimonas terrae]MBB5190887.1 prepilin-type N-terminal cleavage/methylation domain-containing protein [Silvimonas terrae]